MNSINSRSSNLEALRLLSMIMVLNLHSFFGYNHGGGGVLQTLDFFRESTSICAVNVFLIISGYFGIKWKFKSFFNLIFQLFFYSFGVYIFAGLLGYVDFNIMNTISSIKFCYGSWGFITGYLLLYFCAPLLNSFVEKYSTKKILLFIVILFFVENFICRASGFLNYGLIYLIGRFLRKSDWVTKNSFHASKLYWICTLLIFLCVYCLFKFVHIKEAGIMNRLFLGLSYSGPFVILQSIFLFLVFAKMKFQSKFINWCSVSCLSIFLIHMHPLIKNIGYYAYAESLYELPLILHIIKLLILIMCVFFGSILIDKIRLMISNFIYSNLYTIYNKLPSKWRNVDTYIPLKIQKNISK